MTALKTKIQIQSGQAPLKAEVGDIFDQSNAQVKK